VELPDSDRPDPLIRTTFGFPGITKLGVQIPGGQSRVGREIPAPLLADFSSRFDFGFASGWATFAFPYRLGFRQARTGL